MIADHRDAKSRPALDPRSASPAPGTGITPAATARVEAVGLLCPIPITRTARAIKDLRPGDVLELRADDRVVLIDLPNWCRSWRHEYLGHVERGSVLHLFVRKAGGTA